MSNSRSSETASVHARLVPSTEGVGPWLPAESELPVPVGLKISRALVTVAILSALPTLVSTAKELVVARYFGRSDALDAYLIAFLLPSVIIRIVTGAFDSAFVPTYLEMKEIHGPEAARRLTGNTLGWSVLLLLGACLCMGFFATWYLPLVGSGYDAEKLKLTHRLLTLLLPFLLLGGLAGTFTSVLSACEKFALPALTPLLSPLAVVAVIVFGGQNLGIRALALGAVAGMLLEVIVLGWALRMEGLLVMPSWPSVDAATRRVAVQFAAIAVGILLISGATVADQSMAATLKPGSVAALNYGSKVINAIVATAGMGLYTATLPYFSQMVARKDWIECRHTVRRYALWAVVVTVPISLLLIVASQPLISILFQGGAFTPADSIMVGKVQALYALQLPFFALAILFQRLLSSLARNDLVTWAAGASLLFTVLFNLVLMKWIGLLGIALSRTMVQLVSATILGILAYQMLRRRTD